MRCMLAMQLSVVLTVAACGGETAGSDGSQVVVLLAPVLLATTERGEFGANPPFTVRTRSGELFVIDISQSQIVQYAADGSQRRIIGRSGEGPGEFRGITGGGVPPGDSLLVVADNNRGRLLVFGVAEGDFKREVPMTPPIVAGQHWSFDEHGALIPVALGVPVFLRWDTGDDSTRLWGEPTEFRRLNVFASIMSGEPSAIRDGAGWLALMPGEGSLVRYDSAGAIVGTVPLPRRARRGEPDDSREQLRIAKAEHRFLLPASRAMGIHRLPDSSIVVVHLDADGKLNDKKVELTSMKWWVTLYSADLRKICLDRPAAFTTEELSRVLFAGDSVMLLSRLAADDGSVRSELQRVRLDPSACVWQPIAEVVKQGAH